MLIFLTALGVVSLVMGIFLLFSFPTFRQISHLMNRVVFSETWIQNHRVALGILLLGLTGLLFTMAYFILGK